MSADTFLMFFFSPDKQQQTDHQDEIWRWGRAHQSRFTKPALSWV